jgi:hypothetical protein
LDLPLACAAPREAVTGKPSADRDSTITSGELNHRNYRRAKEHARRLQLAISARKPEKEVAPLIVPLALHAGNRLSYFPTHGELRAWCERAEELRGKLWEKNRHDLDLESLVVAGDAAPTIGLYAANTDAAEE